DKQMFCAKKSPVLTFIDTGYFVEHRLKSPHPVAGSGRLKMHPPGASPALVLPVRRNADGPASCESLAEWRPPGAGQ
ncbi:hypothetical protein ACA29_15855, partial [Lederbergia galactosidilytica]